MKCTIELTTKSWLDLVNAIKTFAEELFIFHFDVNTKSVEGGNKYCTYKIEIEKGEQ